MTPLWIATEWPSLREVLKRSQPSVARLPLGHPAHSKDRPSADGSPLSKKRYISKFLSPYKVTAFEITEKYTIWATFDDGTEQVIDFASVLYGAMWGPLRDLALFNQVSIDPISHTLCWPNGADFDPETLRNWPEYKDELAARAQQWAAVSA